MPQYDVFLSHSSVDKTWVVKLKEDLLLVPLGLVQKYAEVCHPCLRGFHQHNVKG